MKTIRVAIYNDPIASSQGTSEEEAADIVEELSEVLQDVKLLEHSNDFNPDVIADIVIIDYGGIMSGAYDHANFETRQFVNYLQEHPNTLGVVWSAFNSSLVETEFEGQFEKLPNLIFRYANYVNHTYSREYDYGMSLNFLKVLNIWYPDNIIKDKFDWNVDHYSNYGKITTESELPPTASEDMVLAVPEQFKDKIEEKPVEVPEEKSEMKHKVQDFPYIEITLRAYDTSTKEWEDGTRSGLLCFHGFATDVTDSDGNTLGVVSGGTGAAIVSITNGGFYQIPHDELWYAIQKALQVKEEK